MDAVAANAMVNQAARPQLNSEALGRAAAERNVRALREAATEFEAHFLSQMMAPMFEGLKTDPPFGGGNSEKIYRSMLIDEYGKEFARQGGLGMVEPIVEQLLRLQEVA